jgi:hypothetical protein
LDGRGCLTTQVLIVNVTVAKKKKAARKKSAKKKRNIGKSETGRSWKRLVHPVSDTYEPPWPKR